LAMASILGKPGSPGQFPSHDLSTVWGALHLVGSVIHVLPPPGGYVTPFIAVKQ
jgi:hypothetical protein